LSGRRDITSVRFPMTCAKSFEVMFVVGHSIIGTLVLEYVRRYPNSVRGLAVIGAPPIGTNESIKHAWKFFEQDADAERRTAHKRNLATRQVPTAITTGRDFADRYIANGAFYWYDPAFDASPLWDGVAPHWETMNHLYFTLYGDYQLEPLESQCSWRMADMTTSFRTTSGTTSIRSASLGCATSCSTGAVTPLPTKSRSASPPTSPPGQTHCRTLISGHSRSWRRHGISTRAIPRRISMVES
jgi:hypothetical protein